MVVKVLFSHGCQGCGVTLREGEPAYDDGGCLDEKCMYQRRAWRLSPYGHPPVCLELWSESEMLWSRFVNILPGDRLQAPGRPVPSFAEAVGDAVRGGHPVRAEVRCRYWGDPHRVAARRVAQRAESIVRSCGHDCRWERDPTRWPREENCFFVLRLHIGSLLPATPPPEVDHETAAA